MAAVFSLLTAIAISLLITRIATEALVLTGLSRQSASFQARSAFTGTGFATKESEKVVNHPVRRRIIMWLMFSGNAGIITVVSSLVLTFMSSSDAADKLHRIGILFIGIITLWFLAINRKFDRYLSRLMRKALRRWTKLDVRDYAGLLHLRGEYRGVEILVNSSDWIANKTLKEADLRAEGILVLGIERSDDVYVGAPEGATFIFAGDTLILYGRHLAIENLYERRADCQGELERLKAIATHQKVAREEKKRRHRFSKKIQPKKIKNSNSKNDNSRSISN